MIQFSISTFGTGLTDAANSAIAAASDVDVMIASSATTMAATDNILVLTTAYANTADMLADISTGASKVTFGTAIAAGDDHNMVVVWSDGNDSYVSLINGSASALGSMSDFSQMTGTTISTLVQLAGVSAGRLAAANFDFV